MICCHVMLACHDNNPRIFSIIRVVSRDSYHGLLESLQYWVVSSPTYPKPSVFFIAQFFKILRQKHITGKNTSKIIRAGVLGGPAGSDRNYIKIVSWFVYHLFTGCFHNLLIYKGEIIHIYMLSASRTSQSACKLSLP